MAQINLDPLVIQPQGPHTHTVIFLHGRGGDPANLYYSLSRHDRDSHARSLFTTFPSFKWVLPQAPMRTCANIRNTTWPQWFDIWNVKDTNEREEEISAPGLREVVPALRDLIAEEARALGGRWDRVILAGISMGCVTGAQTLINLDVPEEGGGRLGAFMGFSGRSAFPDRDLKAMREVLGLTGVPEYDRVVRTTPVLLEHCTDDPLVPVWKGRKFAEILRGFGTEKLEWKEYPTGGHWFQSPNGMDDVVAFINEHVIQKERVKEDIPSARDNSTTDAMEMS